MIDGKPYKTLRRHLSTHGLTPEQYRERYNLKPDYPIVSEKHSAARREIAKKIGLGQKGRRAKATPESATVPTAPRPRQRRTKSA
jgi:predicted transcriptional regulator